MSHVRSPVALTFGVLCLTGTAIVLFGHIHSFADLTINHLYIILALTVTLGSGHFMWGAYSEGMLGIARGLSFTLLFIVGTVVCVGLSGGRSAAILAQRDFDVEQVKITIAKQQSIVNAALIEVTSANNAYQQRDNEATKAQALSTEECATGKNAGKGSKCEGKRSAAADAKTDADTAYQRLQDVKEKYLVEQQKLDAIHLPPPPDTDLLAFAQLYAFFAHIDESQALAKVKLLLPYAFAIITEFGTVAFFQHGFGKPQPKPAALPTVTLVEIAQSLSIKPDEARKKLRALNIPKPSQGWIFTAHEANKIKSQLHP